MEPQPRKPLKTRPEHPYKYTSMGIKMAVVIFAGIYGGFRLDKLIGWKFPVFTLLFSMAALALAIYVMIRDLQK